MQSTLVSAIIATRTEQQSQVGPGCWPEWLFAPGAATNVAHIQQITIYNALDQMNLDNQAVDMNESIQKIIQQVGTDTSGKWISTDNAEKFAQLVIAQYNKELKESRREVKSNLGYSRIGLGNIWKNYG